MKQDQNTYIVSIREHDDCYIRFPVVANYFVAQTEFVTFDRCDDDGTPREVALFPLRQLNYILLENQT